MSDHFSNLVLYAVAISALFSLFMRDQVRDRVKFAAVLAGSLIGAAVAVGWLMFLAG